MNYFETVILSLDDAKDYSPLYLLDKIFVMANFNENERKRVLREVLTISMTLRSLFLSDGGFPGEEWKRVFDYKKRGMLTR